MRIAGGTVTALPFDAEYVRSMTVSNGGSLVTTTTADGSMWIHDLKRQTRTRLPEGGVRYRISPSWSPDNSRIAFFSAMVGYHLYVQPVDGVSDPEVIFGGPEEKGAGAFTPDGQSYVFAYHKATATGANLYRIRLAANQQPERLTKSTASETGPAFSPDGKWLAYTASDTGRFEVFLQPYPELDRRVQVSTSGGSVPRWSPDSGTLFYGSGTRLFAVAISGSGANVTVGQPREVMNIPGVRAAQPTPDGSFIALQSRTDVGPVTELRLIVNWFDELRRIAPRK